MCSRQRRGKQRRGKQITYALLEERVPPSRSLEWEEALAELARRYFTSRGPATLKDYTWWSGLSAADANAGLEMFWPQLTQEVVEGQTYWLAERAPAVQDLVPSAVLLPNYYEYLVGYADRSAVYDGQYTDKLDARGSILTHVIVIDGRVAGTWKRIFQKGSVVIAAHPFAPLTPAEADALASAAGRFGEFLEMPVVSLLVAWSASCHPRVLHQQNEEEGSRQPSAVHEYLLEYTNFRQGSARS